MIFYNNKYKPKVTPLNQKQIFGIKLASKPLLVMYQDAIYEAVYYEERYGADKTYYMIKQIQKEVRVPSESIQKWAIKPEIEDDKH